MNDKQEIRKAMIARRRTLTTQWIEAASMKIIHRLEQLAAFRSAAMIGLYLADDGEVNLDPLIERGLGAGKRCCAPWFNPRRQCYEMAEITSPDAYAPGRFGIREPLAAIPCALEEIDLIAVPGTAFDRRGNRLGRGGGHYDRLLDGFRGTAAGVAFDFQLLPSVPSGPHDRPVNVIVTDMQLVNV